MLRAGRLLKDKAVARLVCGHYPRPMKERMWFGRIVAS